MLNDRFCRALGWLVSDCTCSVQAAERKSPPRRVAGSRVSINTKRVIIGRMIECVYRVQSTGVLLALDGALIFGIFMQLSGI